MADLNGADEVRRELARLQQASGACVRRALSRCGLIAKRESIANAPRSPTMKILSSTLKRKKRTSQRTFPGGLEKSIDCEVTDDRCSVFVASNSFAAAYAKRIHDEKGKTWQNRGEGTVAKGTRADEKFIERAIRDNADAFTKIFKDELDRLGK